MIALEFEHHVLGWVAILQIRRCFCCPPVPWIRRVVAGEA